MERELQSCKGSGAEEARGPQQKSYQLTLAGFEGPTQVMPTVSFTELPCGQLHLEQCVANPSISCDVLHPLMYGQGLLG